MGYSFCNFPSFLISFEFLLLIGANTMDAACGYRLLVKGAKALKRGEIFRGKTWERKGQKKGVIFLDL